MIIFDIETAPRPDIEDLVPEFEAEPFDESSVKLGDITRRKLPDLDKLKLVNEKISAARLAHTRGQDKAAEGARKKFIDQAALDAAYGFIVVIGYLNVVTDECELVDCSGDEEQTIRHFWRKYRQCQNEGRPLAGLNIHDFDLPFIIQRTWILGLVELIPSGVLHQGRFFPDFVVDLRKKWLCGRSFGSGAKSNFDHLSVAFATDGKPDGMTGKDFWEMWQKDRPQAEKYLIEDLKQPAIWAQRMGLI